MKKFDSFKLVVIIPVILFVGLFLTMIVMTGLAMAETPAPEQNPMPEPVCTPAPMAEDDADIDPDFFGNHSYIFKMKAGEERLVRFNIVTGDTPETYILEPDLVVSEASDVDLLVNNDDWVYCTDEWEDLVLFTNDRREIIFDILPPEGTLEGHYEFTYRIIKDFSEILPVGIDIHHDSAKKLLEDHTRYITFAIDIIP